MEKMPPRVFPITAKEIRESAAGHLLLQKDAETHDLMISILTSFVESPASIDGVVVSAAAAGLAESAAPDDATLITRAIHAELGRVDTDWSHLPDLLDGAARATGQTREAVYLGLLRDRQVTAAQRHTIIDKIFHNSDVHFMTEPRFEAANIAAAVKAMENGGYVDTGSDWERLRRLAHDPDRCVLSHANDDSQVVGPGKPLGLRTAFICEYLCLGTGELAIRSKEDCAPTRERTFFAGMTW